MDMVSNDVDPITQVYMSMENLGYEHGIFEDWYERIEIFHVTKTGGLAFVRDPVEDGVWWLNMYCPNEKPDNNTFNFLCQMAAASGCKALRTYVERPGAGRMLERGDFVKIEGNLYERRD